ncbi:uncharacterized protein [Palaemon carinicauda]|uniref:uncharacterized protein n=1 Tax=Palaemon carinicauda TaxID=392227 RepID=UPI0035B5DBC2
MRLGIQFRIITTDQARPSEEGPGYIEREEQDNLDHTVIEETDERQPDDNDPKRNHLTYPENISNLFHKQKEKDQRNWIKTAIRKLLNINGGKLKIPDKRQEYVNLTNYVPTSAQEEILCFGLYCHYMTKPRPTDKRLEIELLLDTIQENERRGALRTTDALQLLLLAEALTDRGHHRSGIITKEIRDAAKALRMQEVITLRRADKTAAFVLINREEYHEKLNLIFADSSKFESFSRNPTEDIKRVANRIIQTINTATNVVHMPPTSGVSGLDYLYGNVKPHKQGNPLRPIISLCPAPTYQLGKRLNTLLTPYIPNKYCVTSSAEFPEKLKNSTSDRVIASMEVKSLFTNVPVSETMDFIIDRIYRNTTTPTLNVPDASLRALLEICTKKAPFTTNKGHIYSENWVAMGSPLGILFANFYMGVVEERVFQKSANQTSMCATLAILS